MREFKNIFFNLMVMLMASVWVPLILLAMLIEGDRCAKKIFSGESFIFDKDIFKL